MAVFWGESMAIRNNARPSRKTLTLALATALLAPVGGAMAQDTKAPDETSEATQTEASSTGQSPPSKKTIDKVTVTGSRIKRADIEGPAPVTVITAEEIQATGLNTIHEVLNTLTQNTGDVDNDMTSGGWTPNGSFINLRAMGPGYTLVLVNGRRMADYPLSYRGASNAVSTSSIPSGAVERIEILSGGASAIYGSDAVAGVVNIITKENYEGDQFRIKGGTTLEGGGGNFTLQWTGGRSGDNWSVTYGADYFYRKPIMASQRDFMDSYYDNPAFEGREEFVNNPATGIRAYRYARSSTRPGLPGVPATANYWIDANGNLVPSAPAEATGAGLAALQHNCGMFGVFEPFNSSASINNNRPNQCGYFGQPATQTIQNKYDRLGAFVSGTYDFDNGMQLYGQFLGTELSSMTASSTRFLQPSGGYSTSPLGLIYHLRYLTPDEIGSPQRILHDEKSFNVATGLRGTIWNDKFDWDIGVAHSRFKYEGKRPWILTGPFYDYFFGGQPQRAPAGVYNVYPYFPNYNEAYLKRWLSPITPQIYRSFADDLVTTGDSQSTQVNLTVGGELFDVPAGPVGVAGVLEWGSQEYENRPDIRTTTDYTGYDKAMGLTSTRGEGKRDRWAAGVEFSIPIFSKLNMSLAGRHDDIDGMAESANTWSAGLEFRPFSNLLLRGNYATSYRAPDMAYVFAQESGGYYSVVDYYRCRRDGLTPTSGEGNPCSSTANPNLSAYAYQVFGLREGSQKLGPEKGKSFTTGFVWDMMDGMSISVDYYNIELKGKVAYLSSVYMLRTEADCRLGQTEDGAPVDANSPQCREFLSIIERNPDAEQRINTFSVYPYNQSFSETAGVDTAWNYRFSTGWGDFALSASHTIVTKLRDQEFPGSTVLDRRIHKQYFDFRSRANWSMSWSKNGWSTYLGGYRLGSLPNWAEDARIGPFIVWNGSISKRITEKLQIGLQVSNLFGARPPRDDTYDSYPYFWRSYQTGAIGRQFGADLTYKF